MTAIMSGLNKKKERKKAAKHFSQLCFNSKGILWRKKYVVAIFDKLSISSERGSLSPTFKTSRNSYDQQAHSFFFFLPGILFVKCPCMIAAYKKA